MNKPYSFKNTTAKIIELIHVTELWGDGTENDEYRSVDLFFSKDGSLLAIQDPSHEHERITYEKSRGM